VTGLSVYVRTDLAHGRRPPHLLRSLLVVGVRLNHDGRLSPNAGPELAQDDYEPGYLDRANRPDQNSGARLIRTHANRNLDTEFCRLEPAWSGGSIKGAYEDYRRSEGVSVSAWLGPGGVAMVYLLVLVILGGGNAGNQSLRVGHYRSLENCQAAANEAKGVGLDTGSFGFVCVRAFGPPDIASAK
jgi:hypothetical protein